MLEIDRLGALATLKEGKLPSSFKIDSLVLVSSCGNEKYGG
jgi:hypothetical protein